MRTALVLVAWSLAVAACSSTGSSTSSSSSSSLPKDPTLRAATELAGFQEGSPTNASDPLVQQFATVLTNLGPICHEGSNRLGGEIYNAWQDLKKNNRPTTLLHVAETLLFKDRLEAGDNFSLVRELTGAKPGQGCRAVIAVYLVNAEKPGARP